MTDALENLRPKTLGWTGEHGRLDSCIHGPGVQNCGHPDCVGARNWSKGMKTDAEYGNTKYGPGLWKICRTCQEILPVSEFHRNGSYNGKPKYRVDCRHCRRAMGNNNAHQTEVSKEAKRRYSKCRREALKRLSHMFPELYQQLLAQEMKKDKL